MNKKDCDSIGYILSSEESIPVEFMDHLVERLSVVDPRIKEEYLAYSSVRLKDEAILDLYTQKMEENLGSDWSLSKRSSIISKDIFNEAKSEIEDKYDLL